jgi:LuxR family maltose regulon positive regulatory protein
VLSAEYAEALLASGQLAGVEERLRDAERWLDAPDTIDTTADLRARNAMVVVDEKAFRLLPVSTAITRAGYALVVGDVASTVKYARRALDLVPEDDHLGRGGAVAFLGLAAWANGDLEAAHRMFTEGIGLVQRAGFIPDVVNGAIARAEIRIAQGRLRDAMRIYEQSLQLAMQTAAEQGVPALRGTADVLVGMSELYSVNWMTPCGTC